MPHTRTHTHSIYTLFHQRPIVTLIEIFFILVSSEFSWVVCQHSNTHCVTPTLEKWYKNFIFAALNNMCRMHIQCIDHCVISSQQIDTVCLDLKHALKVFGNESWREYFQSYQNKNSIICFLFDGFFKFGNTITWTVFWQTHTLIFTRNRSSKPMNFSKSREFLVWVL